jgi:hypothetical protein
MTISLNAGRNHFLRKIDAIVVEVLKHYNSWLLMTSIQPDSQTNEISTHV